MKATHKHVLTLAALAALVLVVLAACGLPGAGPTPVPARPQIFILAPANNSQAVVNQTVTIQVNATDVQAVSRIEIKVDGVLVAATQGQGQPSLDAVQSWIFGQAGSHVVSAQAYNATGQVSDPAVVTLLVTSESAGAVLTDAPTEVPTETPTEPPVPVGTPQVLEACSLLTAAEAEAILGEPAGPPQVMQGGCAFNNASNSLYAVSVGAAQGQETSGVLQGLAFVLGLAGVPLDEARMQKLQAFAGAQDYRGFFDELTAAAAGTAVKAQALDGLGDVAWWAWIEAGERRQGALAVVRGPTLVNVNLVVAAGREETAMLDAAKALAESVFGRLPASFTIQPPEAASLPPQPPAEASVESPSPVPPPVIVSFAVNPASITAGGSATLQWEVSGADTVEIDQGIGSVALSGSYSVSPASTTTYKLTAKSAGGQATATTVVTVQAAPPPAKPVVKSFTVNPASITAGGSSTLQWEVTGASAVEIDQGIGVVDSTGSRQVNPASTTTYKLTAKNAGGQATAEVTLTVQPPVPPQVKSFTADPVSITAGAKVTLQWEVTDATSVEIDNGVGKVAVTGSRQVSPASTTTYKLTALNQWGVVTKDVTVQVAPAAKPAAWSNWEKLGGAFPFAPTVASWAENRLDVFVRGNNTHLMHRWWNGKAWSGWEDLGGELADAPGCVSWAANRLDCFVRGKNDSELWHKWWDGSAWSGWEKLGGVFTNAPTVASWSANRLDVFVRGTNTHLMHRWWNGKAWSGWEDLGGELADSPGCVSWAANRLDCFVRGKNDSELWHKWWDGSAWSGWEKLGGAFPFAPTVASWAENRLDVFVRGNNTHLMHRWWNGKAWSGWEDLGGELADAPGCVSWGANRIDCFVRGKNDSELWHKWWGQP